MFIRTACIATFSVLALTLAGCGESASEPEAAPVEAAEAAAAPAEAEAVTLDGEGLKIASASPVLIAFGAPAAEVIAAVTSALGSDPAEAANPDCPTGATQDYAWGNRLAVITRDGAFIGWHSSEPGPSTASGIQTGATLAEAEAGQGFERVESNFAQSQIAVDGVSGFLTEGDAAVGVLYAGDTCIAG